MYSMAVREHDRERLTLRAHISPSRDPAATHNSWVAIPSTSEGVIYLLVFNSSGTFKIHLFEEPVLYEYVW